MPLEPQPLTTAQVAERFHREVSTIRAWVRNGWIRPIANTGGRKGYLFAWDQVKRREGQTKSVEAY